VLDSATPRCPDDAETSPPSWMNLKLKRTKTPPRCSIGATPPPTTPQPARGASTAVLAYSQEAQPLSPTEPAAVCGASVGEHPRTRSTTPTVSTQHAL
jgi:hypothetical protein